MVPSFEEQGAEADCTVQLCEIEISWLDTEPLDTGQASKKSTEQHHELDQNNGTTASEING